jgi:hypothetical protein
MNDANNSFDHSYYFADWRSAGMAVQHWLGLLPRWRIAPSDYFNLAALARVAGFPSAREDTRLYS